MDVSTRGYESSNLPNEDVNNPILSLHNWAPIHIKLQTLAEKIAPSGPADFLIQKAKVWTEAKILPFSTPDELRKELEKAIKHEKRLIRMKNEFSNHLPEIDKKIAYFESRNNPDRHLKTLKLKELKIGYENRIQGLTEAIKVTNQFINHLKTRQKTTISSRVTGYLGSAANLVAPGTGPGVNLALTSTLAILPVVSASKLNNPKEQSKMRWATAFTALSFIASTALSYYVWPIVNAYATSYFAQQSQK